MLPQQHATPPPQPAPAQVETINAADAQRLASPLEQSVINDVNSGKHGKGFTASMPNTTQQNMQNVKSAAQNAGSIAKGFQDAKKQININDEINNAVSSRKPGYTQRPPDKSAGNKAIANMKAKSANGQQTTSQNASQASQNKGIAAARQKSSSGQASPSNSSTNKGISSFQSKASGQTSSSAQGSSSGATKGGQSR